MNVVIIIVFALLIIGINDTKKIVILKMLTSFKEYYYSEIESKAITLNNNFYDKTYKQSVY